MGSLSKNIKRERNRRHKMIKQVFRARDMASENLKKRHRVVIRVSSILKFYDSYTINNVTSKYLAKDIYDRDGKMEVIRPPKPPTQIVAAKK